jgi:hypothetical protein
MAGPSFDIIAGTKILIIVNDEYKIAWLESIYLIINNAPYGEELI